MREGVPSIINPYDAHALEEAVRLKEKYGGKVTVNQQGSPSGQGSFEESDVFRRG
jgi:electron transfer flavoprotein beta subunit